METELEEQYVNVFYHDRKRLKEFMSRKVANMEIVRDLRASNHQWSFTYVLESVLTDEVVIMPMLYRFTWLDPELAPHYGTCGLQFHHSELADGTMTAEAINYAVGRLRRDR